MPNKHAPRKVGNFIIKVNQGLPSHSMCYDLWACVTEPQVDTWSIKQVKGHGGFWSGESKQCCEVSNLTKHSSTINFGHRSIKSHWLSMLVLKAIRGQQKAWHTWYFQTSV